MKKWKLILTALVLIVAAGAGTLYYFLNVKQYHTTDAKVDKIVKSNYQINLPGQDTNKQQNSSQNGSSESKQTASGNGQTAAGSQTQTAAQTQTQSKTDYKQSSAQASAKAGSSVKAQTKLSSSEILAEYQPVFKDLENQANGKIDTLLTYAINEYSTKKARGENISYFYFYAKYNVAGKELETTTDASFNYVYGALVSDLKKNGYNTSVADPIKGQYESMKKSRRTALLKKAIENFS